MEQLILDARTYALAAHGALNQLYGTEPYIVHCDEVVDILIEYGHNDAEIQAAGFLHDVVEDCDIPLVNLERIFPAGVTYLVDGVTTVPKDEAHPNRKTRNAATYPKIAEHIRRVTLKLADRLANVRRSKRTNSDLFLMYKKEYPDFRRALYTNDASVAPMWEELDTLLGDWVKEF